MPKLRFCALPMGSNLWQPLKTFNLFRLLENETLDIFSVGGRSKSKQILSNESLRSWRGKRIFYKSWNWKWSFRLVCKFSLDFRKISCFISKNILSKVVLKYEISMLTCPSTVYPTYISTISTYISTTTIYQLEISKVHIHLYLPLSQSVFYEVSFYYI